MVGMNRMMSCGIHEQGWRKGPWTPEEDKLLIVYVSKHGEGRWSTVAWCAGLNRTGKSCRLRWVNYLRPGLKRGQLTPQEEGIIIELHALWGNRWSIIARYLPGRTDNEIKNYWRTHFKNKVQKQDKRSQILKEKRDHPQLQLLQQKQQPREHDMQKVQDIFNGTTENVEPMIETQEKQDMLSAYPAMEDKCAPPSCIIKMFPQHGLILQDIWTSGVVCGAFMSHMEAAIMTSTINQPLLIN